MKVPLPRALKKPAAPGDGNSARPASPLGEIPADLVGWLDERTGGSSFLTGMLFRKVPKGTNWFYTLGSATLFAFTVQAVTGVFLAMFYTPSPTQAYASVTHLTNDVFLGEFVRGMHKWGASVMIILIYLHMARTFIFGAYKYPRELNWVIGVVLLILTMVMGFTGYLLPFDQRSFWATVVGVNINGTGPFLGPYLSDFLRAGAEFGPTTLSRFYAIHMLLVPGLIIALIGAHLYLVVKLGTTAPPWLEPKRSRATMREEAVAAAAASSDGAAARGRRRVT
jgi:quinol-cytochrome oxidoreductase complex cytochrome b subunit